MTMAHDEFASGRDPADVLVVTTDAFEGPLDLLLHLVRAKKVEIERISVLDVVDQFILWMTTAREMRLELAADWLVMMANLAFIKSKLLLPVPKDERAAAEAVVEDLTVRLRRLDAIRSIAEALGGRARLGIDCFGPGLPDAAKGPGKRLEASLHAILSAYVQEARYTLVPQQAPVRNPHHVLTVEDAIAHLGKADVPTDRFASVLEFVSPEPPHDLIHARSRIASTYVAALELAKRGRVEVEQHPVVIGIRRIEEARS
ncbi:scpA/B family protein (plasmid) [Bosea sp. RAC05]|nr:scpA/B family protein [Bosea sp. RAC05]